MNEKITLKKLLKNNDLEAHLYVIGLAVASLLLTVIGVLAFISHTTGVSFNEFCVFNRLTGYYCPGCGGTRAFLALLHGKILQSIIFHPAVTYVVMWLFIFYFTQTLRFITHGRIQGLNFHKVHIFITVFLLVANMLVKNIMLIFWHVKVM